MLSFLIFLSVMGVAVFGMILAILSMVRVADLSCVKAPFEARTMTPRVLGRPIVVFLNASRNNRVFQKGYPEAEIKLAAAAAFG